MFKPITFYLYPLAYRLAIEEEKRMNPEPVDEGSRKGVETRGGNRPEDYSFPEWDENGTFPYLDDDEEASE